MRPTRLFLGLLLACAVAPGTLVRAPEPPSAFDPEVKIATLPVAPATRGPFTLIAAWQMTGDPFQFGGLSALVPLGRHRFLAATDGGRALVFERPDRGRQPGILAEIGDGGSASKIGRDIESLAIDPGSGRVWAGYEFRNAIQRLSPRLEPEGEVRPAAMEEWGGNSGPEAFVRLADGRFLAVEERAREWGDSVHNALVFAGDPLNDAEPEALLLRVPDGYRPVDAAPLAGGRALVLLRRIEWGFPPVFFSALGAVDVERPEKDGTVSVQLLAELDEAIPQDNYEGLAITRDGDGTHVWLVSDDNFTAFQRTLLLKLRWEEREKARE